MKILITGSNGFIGKNLIEFFKRDSSYKLYLFNRDDSIEILEAYIKEADFIFHLAGANRPSDKEQFYRDNHYLTKVMIDFLEKNNKKTPIVFSSSIQATHPNDYGQSKLLGENLIVNYSKKNKIKIFIFRLPNVFGKWSKPNYNSVVATWCFNISHGLEIQVNDETTILELVYIDDVIQSFGKCFSECLVKSEQNNFESNEYFVNITPRYQKSLGEIKNLLFSFRENRNSLLIPEVGIGFNRALYATYLSYLDSQNFSYKLKGHQDERGEFYEVLKTNKSGQFSISTTKPGVTRGNHYHNTKNEKFLVVQGEARIELRHILNNEMIVYEVSDKNKEVVEMIPGYTHNIKNIGHNELLLLLWANETYDANNPDTYILPVAQ